jgi:hypothetical protein
VAGSCEYGDEPSGSGTKKLVSTDSTKLTLQHEYVLTNRPTFSCLVLIKKSEITTWRTHQIVRSQRTSAIQYGQYGPENNTRRMLIDLR